jgi:hypothetical protein
MKPPPTHAIYSQMLVLTLALLVFSGSLGLGAVWMRQQISGAANRSRTLEGQLADVERRLDEVNSGVAAAVNPSALLQRNTTMRLGLASPKEVQVVRVNEVPELRLAAKRNREVFNARPAGFAADGAPAFRIVTASLR